MGLSFTTLSCAYTYADIVPPQSVTMHAYSSDYSTTLIVWAVVGFKRKRKRPPTLTPVDLETLSHCLKNYQLCASRNQL